jgi:hypothetical protein
MAVRTPTTGEAWSWKRLSRRICGTLCTLRWWRMVAECADNGHDARRVFSMTFVLRCADSAELSGALALTSRMGSSSAPLRARGWRGLR